MTALTNALGILPAYEEAWTELGGMLGLSDPRAVQVLRGLMLEHSTQEHQAFLPPGYMIDPVRADEDLIGGLRVLPSDWKVADPNAVYEVRFQVEENMVDRHSIPHFEFPSGPKGYHTPDGTYWVHFLMLTKEDDCRRQPKNAWDQWMWTLGLKGDAALVLKDLVLEYSDRLWRDMPPALQQLSLAHGPGLWVEPRLAQFLTACAREKLNFVAKSDVFIPLGAPVHEFDDNTWVTAFYRAGSDRYPFLPDLPEVY